MNLTYGSRGEEVKKLQTALNSSGYGLAVDGIYGAKTQAAVRDYQSRNGLSVDGIAGTNTLGKLYGTNTTDTAETAGNSGSAAEKKPDYSQYAYDPSADTAYQQALSALQQAQKALPSYQATYDQQLQDIYNQIVNRDKFSYDVNSDALYQQYADQYTQQGQLAMMNTMGQAAALTGGYGNSYASTAGNQAYQGYLQQLNAVVPELYGMALDQYNQEGQNLLNQYAMVGDMADDEYAKYQDSLNQYWQNLSFQKQLADDAYDQGYNNWYNAYQAGYQAERDAVADKQWQAEYDEAVRQFNVSNGISSGSSGGSGGSSGGSGGSGGSGRGSGSGGSYTSNPGYTSAQIKSLQQAAGITADGVWGPQTAAAYDAGARPTSGAASTGSNPNYNPNLNGQGSIGGTGGIGSFATYSEAVAYMKSNGVSGAAASGIMTKSEWARSQNKQFRSYGDYLDAIVSYKISTK